MKSAMFIIALALGTPDGGAETANSKAPSQEQIEQIKKFQELIRSLEREIYGTGTCPDYSLMYNLTCV